MPDTFVENIPWGRRIMDSIKGVFFGIIFFFGSFVVLWMNEGRIDMSKIAKMLSVPIGSTSVDPSAEGKFVSITGPLKSGEQVGDPEFVLEGAYIQLTRQVEMYSWKENKTTKDNKTTYDYKKEWTRSPDNSGGFKYSEGHSNPQMPYNQEVYHVEAATVGAYPVDMSSIELTGGGTLKLSDDILTSQRRIDGDYLFEGSGTMQQPQIGDVRIRFSALMQDTNVTAFGVVSGGALAPFVYKEKNTLYRALEGTREQAISRMHLEFQVIAWGLRIAGFIMMWLGLTLLFGPITAVLDVVPILGTVSRFVSRLFMFVIAFFLSIVTMLISTVVHNLIALIVITLLLMIGIAVLLVRSRQKAVASRPA